MKSYKFYIPIISVFLNCASMVCILKQDLPSAEPVSLTLKQCISFAREKSELLEMRLERINQAGYRLKQARGGRLPDIRYQYSLSLREKLSDTSGEGMDSKFVLNQPLYKGSKKTLLIDYSKAYIEKEKLDYLTLARELDIEVTYAFYNLVRIDSDIANLSNTFKLMTDRLNELSDRVKLGKSRDTEVLSVESQIASLRAQLETYYGERAKHIETLSFLTGVAPDSIAVNDDMPPVKDVAPLEKYTGLIRHRSDVESARQELLMQTFKTRSAKGSALPGINLSGAWHTHRNGNLSGVGWETLFSLDIPLYQGGILKGGLAEEKSRLKEYETMLSLAIRQAELNIKTLYNDCIASVKQVEALKSAYQKSVENYNLQLRDYRYGLVNNLDVIQTMMSMSDTKLTLDRTLIQAKSDFAVLEITSKND
ncbi:MAG: outer membrane channel protein [Elusimicrobia bacterium ADurb.Bin231]|nr:MAG: outer membrane channel protein [Elusimicrobia bacterium ADurb.Bin231]